MEFIIIGVGVGAVIILSILYYLVSKNAFDIWKRRYKLNKRINAYIRKIKQDDSICWEKGKYTNTLQLYTKCELIRKEATTWDGQDIKVFVNERVYKKLIRQKFENIDMILHFAMMGFWVFEDNHIIGNRYKIAYKKSIDNLK